MSKFNLQDSFIEFCKKNSFEKNNHQIEIVNLLDQFLHPKKTFFKNLFINKNKFCFYLHGNVGVGKTMILNFIYDQLILLLCHIEVFQDSYLNISKLQVRNSLKIP